MYMYIYIYIYRERERERGMVVTDPPILLQEAHEECSFFALRIFLSSVVQRPSYHLQM